MFMDIKFITRSEFESLPGIPSSAISNSGECSSVEYHANGKEIENKLKQIHDYGFITGIRDCIAVAVIPDDKNKPANIIHFNTGHFLDNLPLIKELIQQGLGVYDLNKSKSVILGAFGKKVEFGKEYEKKYKESQRLLSQIQAALSDTGTEIIEFIGQIPKLEPLAACESHMYLDRQKETIYICSDYLKVALNEAGRVDESALESYGGISARDEIRSFFEKISRPDLIDN